MRRYSLYPFLWIILFACTTRSRQTKNVQQDTAAKNHFSNIIQVAQYGDSVRLEIEKTDTGIIKHYIDLKGLVDDNFDNSYNVVCKYKTINNDTSITSGCFFKEGDYQLNFDQKQLVAYCDSIIQHLAPGEYNNEVIKPPYEKLKKYALHKSTSYALNYIPELIINLPGKIVNTKTKELPQAILIEFYKTEFSAGKNFYLISDRGDTLNWIHHLDYIN
ncbi:hypothetical protein [Ferruginibacter sp.]